MLLEVRQVLGRQTSDVNFLALSFLHTSHLIGRDFEALSGLGGSDDLWPIGIGVGGGGVA